MKRTTYFLAGLLLVATLGSCEKDQKDANNFGPAALNNGAVITAVVASSPKSDGGIVPSIIPGANRGGNRTCAEVADAFNTTFDMCGDKVDYNGYFAGTFPDGLEVKVTSGKFVEFKMDECILIGDKYYKVGAVIVKGSNQANVYYYPGGTLGDSGLAAPVNASGSSAGLSNLTFCFYECDEPPRKILALKSYMKTDWAVTGGGLENDYFIGCLPLAEGAKYDLYLNGQLSSVAGYLEVGDFDKDDLLEVRITSTVLNSYFTDVYLYVGPEGSCTKAYRDYPHIILGANSAVVTFQLNF